MSPQAGFILLEQIEPRLRSAIPECVHKVGAEDDEELLQDGLYVPINALLAIAGSGCVRNLGDAYPGPAHGSPRRCRFR